MSGPREKITVEHVTDPAMLVSLRRDWNRLVDESRRPTVFLTWEWLHAWWIHFGKGLRLHLLLVRDPSGKDDAVTEVDLSREGAQVTLFRAATGEQDGHVWPALLHQGESA